MTATPDAPARAGASPAEVPARADGVELIGELPGSGYKKPPALVRRADGQTVQLTRLLFVVLDEIDGQPHATTRSRPPSASRSAGWSAPSRSRTLVDAPAAAARAC